MSLKAENTRDTQLVDKHGERLTTGSDEELLTQSIDTVARSTNAAWSALILMFWVDALSTELP